MTHKFGTILLIMGMFQISFSSTAEDAGNSARDKLEVHSHWENGVEETVQREFGNPESSALKTKEYFHGTESREKSEFKGFFSLFDSWQVM